ncbi:MAG TPA: dihydrolipoamide acetyltransferase family protein [Gemmatimonadales bacterium]|nr:dihydrolipoamide acetyltransferase family protein [Gemmatimonadales bacterium]
MATKIVMEALSPTMEEGRLVEWKKQEGESVTTGDVLAEVETDKAVMELVARADGVLLKQVIAAGTTVPVADLVGIIGEPGEDIAALLDGAGAKPPTPPEPATTAAAPAPAPMQQAEGSPAPETSAPVSPPMAAPGQRIKASPLARRIATERGLDLAAIRGSGPEGRIVKRDLDRQPAAAPGATAAYPSAGFTDVPLTMIRKAIATRLAQSIGPIPTFYLTTEVEMDRAWEAREALKAVGPEGKVSFNDIILKATALALRQHPACNAWWQGDHIRLWHEVHVGVAVAVEDGLITPVIRHADHKSLREISSETRDLADRARARKLTPEEYTGATFSVSNLGMFDIDQFTAVINPPEGGILAVGSIVEKPVIVAGQVSVGRRMRVTMSCDHRVIDGATGAQFLQTLTLLLENPLAMVW